MRLERLSGNNFLVVGRVGMDLSPLDYGIGTDQAQNFSSGVGGSSANIAVGICKLGGQAALITTVSDDAVGEFCINGLQKYHVSTEYVRKITGEYRTSLAIYENRLENHRNVIYRNNAADFQMDMQDVNAPDYAQYSGVVTTGTVFAMEPSRAAGYRAMENGRSAEIPVIFDIDYRPYSWTSAQDAAKVLSKAADMSDIIIGNDEEFDFMAGDAGKGLALARKLGQDPNRIIVYKMGELGAITIQGGTEFQTGIFKVDALKPTGAGDSFMSAFIASLAQGRALKEAVTRGSAAAAIVVAKPMCAPAMAYEDELDAFLLDHPGMTDPLKG